MKSLCEQDLSSVSGGDAWVSKNDRDESVLIVTGQSVASFGDLEFHADYVTMGGHAIYAPGTFYAFGGRDYFQIDGVGVYVAPYYDTSAKRIGSIYSTGG